ncbi:UNKNOWN [Stylonychia lemnae]|uniref:EF-hand domain-containing protein n=1 Tax=Stylonychia lemnae TaxID=5949 RepID=A0A078ANR6_STYLE|nr:UNKNOWN [Stylonychia lemnae]|eukprot:CDW83576.1 UNKNOWN [Stylonychia lemnae]
MFKDSKAIQAGIERDKEFKDKCARNSLDIIKGTKSSYRLYTKDEVICIATAASGFTWDYQLQSHFWMLCQIENSLFGKKLYKCVDVWWFNPKWRIEKIPPGVYHVYLRHGNKNISVQYRFSHYQGVGFKADQSELPSSIVNIPFDKNQNRLINTYVATLDLSEAEGLTNIVFELFSQINLIRNYLVEGSILVPVQSLEQLPNFYFKLEVDTSLVDIDWDQKVQEIQYVIPKIHQNKNEDNEKDPSDQEKVEFDDMIAKESNKAIVERLKDMYTETWEKFDENRNGYLDKQEFRNCLKELFGKLKYPIDEAKVEQYFKKSDTYQSGQISKSQIHWLFEQIITLLMKKEEQQKEQEKINKKELELKAQNDSTHSLEDQYYDGKIKIKGSIKVQCEGKQLPAHQAENLIQKDGKWSIEACAEASIIINFEEEIEFMVFGIKSADDAPKMDPASIKLSVMKGEQFEVILSKDNLMFDERFQNRLFKPNEHAFQTTQLKIDLCSAIGEGLQLSEIMLYKQVK